MLMPSQTGAQWLLGELVLFLFCALMARSCAMCVMGSPLVNKELETNTQRGGDIMLYS